MENIRKLVDQRSISGNISCASYFEEDKKQENYVGFHEFIFFNV